MRWQTLYGGNFVGIRFSVNEMDRASGPDFCAHGGIAGAKSRVYTAIHRRKNRLDQSEKSVAFARAGKAQEKNQMLHGRGHHRTGVIVLNCLSPLWRGCSMPLSRFKHDYTQRWQEQSQRLEVAMRGYRGRFVTAEVSLPAAAIQGRIAVQ